MAFLFSFVKLLCQALTIIIFIRVMLSWFSPKPNTLTFILDKITEPILAPLRRIIPGTGMFDFTPLAAIVLLQLIIFLLP